MRLRQAEQGARPRAEELALVDIGLPGLDGYRVAEELRSRVGDNIRLVAMTGYGGPEGHDRALQAGFDLHLVKPVKPDELDRLLATL
nr:response regulator [Myxococcus sp. RHSTA-1-4]